MIGVTITLTNRNSLALGKMQLSGLSIDGGSSVSKLI